jgi:hypothetical protein
LLPEAAIKNGEPTFDRCRARKSNFRHEASRLLLVGHTRGDAAPVFLHQSGPPSFSAVEKALALGRDARLAGDHHRAAGGVGAIPGTLRKVAAYASVVEREENHGLRTEVRDSQKAQGEENQTEANGEA